MADDQNTSVTLDQIKELIGGLKTELIQEIDTRTNKAVTGMGTKLAKSLETKQGESVGTLIEERLTKVLDGVLKESEGSGDPEQQAGESESSSDDPTARFQAVLQQREQEMLQKIEEQEQETQKRIKAMQDAVEAERLNSAKLTARNKVLDPLRDQLHNPDSFWSDLERLGASYDQDRGVYGVSGKDEFDNPTFTPLSDSLEGYQKKLAYQFKPRPGSGTGTQPAKSSNGGGAAGNAAYSTESKTSSQERFDAIRKSADPIADIVAKATAASN
ncbi:MAG: hypothetical protein AAF810_21290 [Cyanobacteria bacterium P01_D01_bin.36]